MSQPSQNDLTDAEIGELDDLLAQIPAPLEALDVVMLDGYLCGVLAQPVPVDIAEWLPPACDWNLGDEEQGGGAVLTPDTAGWHGARHERLLALVQRRFDALNRQMVEDGWFDPVVMQPLGEDDEPLTGRAQIEGALGPWIIGFEHALNHFPGLEDLPHPDIPDLLACLRRPLPDQSEGEQAYAKALGRAPGASDEVARRGDRGSGRQCGRAGRHRPRRAAEGHAGASQRAQGRPQRPLPVRQRSQVQAVPRPRPELIRVKTGLTSC